MTGRVRALSVVLGLAVASDAGAAIQKTLDRKFPVAWCPWESRAAAGVDLSFVAPASTVRLVFSAPNRTSGGDWQQLHLDNVTIVAKSVFDAHLVGPAPGYEDCYSEFNTPPGIPEAPAYDFNAAGTPEVLLDLFDANASGWTGASVYWDTGVRAPRAPATGTDLTGGSLGMGTSTDGSVTVTASKLVGGLTPGQTYVVFAWWYSFELLPLTISIQTPCADADGDGRVLCTASCDVGPDQSCGDCDDANPRCGTTCTDGDGDGWCRPDDCDDGSATCSGDCATDADGDAEPDCRDRCLDADGDRYGTAGGGGNQCLGADCDDAKPFCTTSCTDADADGHCSPGDCQDGNPLVGNDLPEINDRLDQNCPGDREYGAIDEVSGTCSFPSKTSFAWPAQSGATGYLAVRSGSPLFPFGCTTFTTSTSPWNDSDTPAPGAAFYYLVRAQAPSKGSWGSRTSGERPAVCAEESDCDNLADDDADGDVDCADTDCAGTPGCAVQTFTFVDTAGDDIADDALRSWFQAAAAAPTDYIFFEIAKSASGSKAWCSIRADWYRALYLDLAATQGSATSGSWDKWTRTAPATTWSGPSTAGHPNDWGNNCFGPYSWCSEQFPAGPQNAVFPDRINDCEVYDLHTGDCGASTGQTYTLTLRIATTRLAACGF